MGKAQRDKGARWERWVANYFEDWLGIPCRRGYQRRSGGDEPDVVVEGLDLWIECKKGKKTPLRPALAQAKGECKGSPCLVVNRDDRQEPMVLCTLEDFRQLVEMLLSQRSRIAPSKTISSGVTSSGS